MFKRTTGVLILITIMLAMSLPACGKKEEPADTVRTNESFSEMGDSFASDLQRIILPNRESTKNLPDYGFVLIQDGETYGVDSLTEFFTAYQGKNDGEVTMIFTGSSFVAVRVVSVDGEGYYLRYEYDKFKPDDIEISCLFVDKMDLKFSNGDGSPKWAMTLSVGKKDIVFELKNPSEQD